MKKYHIKWVALCSIIIISIFILFTWLGTSQQKISLYNNTTEVKGVNVDLKIDTGYNQIIYVIYNTLPQDIKYSTICAIEYFDGFNWNEVLTKTGKRASESTQLAVEYILPAATADSGWGYNFGVKHLDGLSHMPNGQYRLVILTSSDQVIISDPFEWNS